MRPFSRTRIGWLAAIVLAAGAAPPLSGQCPPGWRKGFELPGLVSAPDALAVHDDGSGPAVHAAVRIGTVNGIPTSRVYRWNGAEWLALGGDFLGPSAFYLNSGVFALVSFDDGSGPALYAGGSFYDASGTPAANVARWNGTAWTTVGAGLVGGNAFAFPSVAALAVLDVGGGPTLHAAGTFGMGGASPVSHVARWNGSAWLPVGTGFLYPAGTGGIASVFALEAFDDGSGPALYAGGIFQIAGGTLADNVARWDGASWSPVGPGVTGTVRTLRAFDDGGGSKLYAGRSHSFSLPLPAPGLSRWNGVQWSPVGSGVGLGWTTELPSVHALLAWDDGSGPALYAGGHFTLAGGQPIRGIARWNGTSWSGLDTGIGPVVNTGAGPVTVLAALGSGADGSLVAGGTFSTAGPLTVANTASWSGSSWSALGGQGLPRTQNFPFYCLEALDLGNGPALHAAGQFLTAGTSGLRNLARWDGSGWAIVGGLTFLGGSIDALAVFDSGSGPELVAGGIFNTINGAPILSVARLTAAGWAPFGAGLEQWVHALTVFDGGSGPELYAGGLLGYGATPFFGLGRWNGTAWLPTGLGQSSVVEALLVHDDGSGPALYAGGQLFLPGTTWSEAIARWNGTSWSTVGGGLWGSAPSTVSALAVHDDGTGPALYAGGSFFFGSGAFVPNVARWDGTAWAPLGAGVNGTLGNGYAPKVHALASFDDGTGRALYAGGDFTLAGLQPASGIARWANGAWSVLEGGMAYDPDPLYAAAGAPVVRALEVFDDGSGAAVFAGGSFHRAGAQPSAGIAAWGRPRPVLSLSLAGGPGSGVLVRNSRVLPGHEYFNIFSAEPCPAGVGLGPWLGLCTSDPAFLIAQILVPPGTPPFRFVATQATALTGPYPVPSGLVIDALCLDGTGGILRCVSPVSRFSVP